MTKLKKKYQRVIWLIAGLVMGLALPIPRLLGLSVSVLWFLAVGWFLFRHLPFINWHISLALAGKFTDYTLKERPIAYISLGLALTTRPLAGALWVIGLLLLAEYGKRQWNTVIWPLFTEKPLPGAPVHYWLRPGGLGDVIRLTDVWADYTRSGTKPPARILCNSSGREIVSLLIGSDNVEVWESFAWLSTVKKGARIADLRKLTELDNEHSHAHAFANYLNLPKPQGYLVFPQEVRQKMELEPGMVWILLCSESVSVSRTLSAQVRASLIESLFSWYPNLGICISAKDESQIAIRHDRLKDFSGRLSLANLLSLVNTVDGIITTDNGSLHLGIALEKPIFAYFSTMPAWRVLPTPARNLTFSEYKGACAPCLTHGDLCPGTDRDDSSPCPCMQTFPVDDVRAWLEATFAQRLSKTADG